SCPPGVRFWLNHSLLKQREDERELLLALRLPAKDAACLFCYAAPLPMTVGKLRGDHLLNLLVGIGVGAYRKLIKPIPQGCNREVNHLTGCIEQSQGIRLDLIWQTQGIAQVLLITTCVHLSSSFCL